MEAIILSAQQYKELVNRLDVLNKKLEEKQKSPNDTFLDNQEFLQLMNISKRTAQSWRDEGKVSFSQNRFKNLLQNERCTKAFRQKLQSSFF